MTVSRRLFTLGLIGTGMSGCTAINSLNAAAKPRATYQLQPVAPATRGARAARRLLVVSPTAPAAIATDRILLRDNPLSVTYLPDARWAEPLPQMLQLLMIQSVAGTGRASYVGAQGSGPVPDLVLLTRVDAFDVTRQTNGNYLARVQVECTLLRDRDQRVLSTRRFTAEAATGDVAPETVVQSFQSVLDSLMPDLLDWLLVHF